MIKPIKYILIVLLAMGFFNSHAQNSQVLYYMNLSQNHLLNPALRPSNTFYLGFPVISGIDININNNFVNFSDVFMKSASGDSVISIFHPGYDISRFVPKIKDVNAIEPRVMVQLFGLGFNAGKDLYVFLDINERVEGNVAVPGDLFRLALEGNEQFVGSKMDLSSLRADVKYFREAGLGFSKNITSKLRIGVRGKVLFGIAAASIDNRLLNITVNDSYTHTLNADLTVNLSAPVNAYINSQNTIDSIVFDDSRFDSGSNIANYLLKTPNLGFGLDIGAEYRITERMKVSAGIADIGLIKWKRDLTNMKAESTFEFSGIDLLDVYNGKMTFDSLATELLDSLKNSFYLTDSNIPFTTYLPLGVTLGGSYNLSKSFSLGVLSYSRIIGKQIKEALTLSANVNFGNFFSTSFAYTVANKRYDNLGFSLAFRLGWFQIYALADRIPVTWNKIISDGSNIPLPVSWNTIQARIGMNFAFGNKPEKKNDKPMIMIEN